MGSLNIITTTSKEKRVHIDESQNIIMDNTFVLGGKSLDRPINGKELETALDSFALMHPKVENGKLYYYCGSGVGWNEVNKR